MGRPNYGRQFVRVDTNYKPTGWASIPLIRRRGTEELYAGSSR